MLRWWPTVSETFVAREIEELRRRGHAVCVAALGRRSDGDLADALDVDVFRPARGLARLRAAPGAWRLRALCASHRARFVAGLGDLPRWAARRGVQRVHAHFAGEAAEVAQAVAGVLDVPWSVTAHAVDLHKPRPSLGGLLRVAQPAFVVTEATRKLVRLRYGVDARLQPMGVPVPMAPSAHPEVEPPCVVTVARHVPKKNLDALVAAAAALDLRLRLVSDHPGAPGVVTGLLPPSEVAAVLAQFQIFALPCRRAPDGDEDALPVALLEAMAAGLPVVTTDAGGIGEVVDDSVGWLAPAGDDDAFREALAAAAANPNERASRGRAGFARVQGRTVAAQVDALLAGWAAG